MGVGGLGGALPSAYAANAARGKSSLLKNGTWRDYAVAQVFVFASSGDNASVTNTTTLDRRRNRNSTTTTTNRTLGDEALQDGSRCRGEHLVAGCIISLFNSNTHNFDPPCKMTEAPNQFVLDDSSTEFPTLYLGVAVRTSLITLHLTSDMGNNNNNNNNKVARNTDDDAQQMSSDFVRRRPSFVEFVFVQGIWYEGGNYSLALKKVITPSPPIVKINRVAPNILHIIIDAGQTTFMSLLHTGGVYPAVNSILRYLVFFCNEFNCSTHSKCKYKIHYVFDGQPTAQKAETKNQSRHMKQKVVIRGEERELNVRNKIQENVFHIVSKVIKDINKKYFKVGGYQNGQGEQLFKN